MPLRGCAYLLVLLVAACAAQTSGETRTRMAPVLAACPPGSSLEDALATLKELGADRLIVLSRAECAQMYALVPGACRGGSRVEARLLLSRWLGLETSTQVTYLFGANEQLVRCEYEHGTTGGL